jgi:hypothetical protein
LTQRTAAAHVGAIGVAHVGGPLGVGPLGFELGAEKKKGFGTERLITFLPQQKNTLDKAPQPLKRFTGF